MQMKRMESDIPDAVKQLGAIAMFNRLLHKQLEKTDPSNSWRITSGENITK